eukprot:3966721-Amphidinium_carterae.1
MSEEPVAAWLSTCSCGSEGSIVTCSSEIVGAASWGGASGEDWYGANSSGYAAQAPQTSNQSPGWGAEESSDQAAKDTEQQQ